MKFSSLVRRVSGDGADAWQVHLEARRARERGEDVILLSIGDPDIDTPTAVTERAIAAMRAGDTHYTPAAGRPALRAALAQAHAARTGQLVDASQVIFLAGVQNALYCAASCVAETGDEVIAFEPLYPTYPATIESSGAKLVRVPASAARRFHVDLGALESAITPRTRALFFATPNNPSGVILKPDELSVVGELARRHSLWVVVDEVYAGLAPGGCVPGLAASLPDQVITVSSFSKSHAMPGWRAGWLVGPTELVRHVEALTMCMLYGLPGFIQEAALTALEVAEKAQDEVRALCAARRDFFLGLLADVPLVRCHRPDAGMFLLMDVSATGLSGAEFVRAFFDGEGVSVLDGGAFGRETRDCVRICFAADEAILRETVLRLRRFLTSRGRGRAS